MPRERFGRDEGRRLFGEDPAAYDRARPGHPERVYETLVERCGLGPGTAVLEIGPGTGQATRRFVELGADPLVVVEPDPALADYLRASIAGAVEIRVAPLEDVALEPGAFDLVTAASSFHWVDEAQALAQLFAALRPGGRIALWWTLFGEPGRRDAYMTAIEPLLVDLDRSPSSGEAGRPAFALDVEARGEALAAAGFDQVEHELLGWSASWDTAGIRALYGTFSPIARLPPDRRRTVLDGIARVAERDFGGRIERALTTSLYIARKPR